MAGRPNYGTHVHSHNGGRDYLRISSGPQRGKYVAVLVLEAKLGRPLRPGYQAHHANGNTLDNEPGNLEERYKGKHSNHRGKRR
jgi:hypothetical protein